MTTASRVRLRLAGDERLVASVRRGDSAAFEALYDRHSAELLSFCVYMLGSRQDAEDAVQATFAAAYRTLRADRRAVALRPWLFAIARNDCLSILRRRRPWVELNGEPALSGDPFRALELREEVRHMIEGLRALPESQRACLVLAELHGFSQAEIGTVLGVRSEQVKAFICQARSNLISERSAREADCCEIREELATARGTALLRGRLRRHLRSCDDCRTYADGISRQRRHLGVLLPLGPGLVLKYRALEEALASGVMAEPAGGVAVGGSVAGTAAEVAGGGFKALILKIAAGVACLGAGAGAGSSVLVAPAPTASASLTSTSAALAGAGSSSATERAGAPARRVRGGSSAPARRGAGASSSPAGHAGRPMPGGKRYSPAPGSAGAYNAAHRREELEQRLDEHQRRAEEEHRSVREQRPPGPSVLSLAQRQRAWAERSAASQRRVAKTEQEHQQASEERKSKRVGPPPKPTKEDRQRAHEERKSERVKPPPKSEEEQAQAREERLRRREAKKAASGG